MSLIKELSRRNVFRVGGAYAILGWLLAQIADLMLDAFGAPEWAMKALVALLLLGFPFVVLFAWAYEVTPDGIKRESEVDRTQSITSQTAQRINIVIITGLMITLVVQQFYLPQQTETQPKSVAQQGGSVSIAVMPFVDLSQAGDQAYLGAGVAEEILNVLAGINGAIGHF